MKRLGWLFLLTLCAAPAYALPGATTTYLVCNDTLMAACSLGAAGLKAVPGIASTAESSAVLNTARFSRIGLRIRAVPAGGDTTNSISFAIAFKVPAPDSTTGGASDSLAGIWRPFADEGGLLAATATVYDTLMVSGQSGGTYDLPPGGGGGCGLWPGEFLFTVKPWMGRGTLKSNQYFGVTTFWVPLSNGTSGGNIPPRLQVRIRQLRGATVASGNKARIQAWLDCTE